MQCGLFHLQRAHQHFSLMPENSYRCRAAGYYAGLLARSQYSEGPATGHLDTSFSWFPCA